MEEKQGKIIAVVGAPRSGKSFLTGLLAEHYDAIPLYEGEVTDIPERILEDIEKNIRPLERILWFRNQAIKRHLEALELKKQGKTVVMDTFWITYQFYIETLLGGFEKEIMLECASLDLKTFAWPDQVIFLSIDEGGMKQFIQEGGRVFEQNKDFIQNQALPVNKRHQDFFVQNQCGGRVFTIDRSSLDFTRPEDFASLIQKIQEIK